MCSLGVFNANCKGFIWPPQNIPAAPPRLTQGPLLNWPEGARQSPAA